jgi:DNA-binding CsgD family transcriptional regulator
MGGGTGHDLNKNLNNLADLLEQEIRRRLPDNARESGLGINPDIRQQTCLRLLQSHLAGNAKLIEATKSGDEADIAAQIDISISTALRYERQNGSRGATEAIARKRELTEDNGGVCHHPAGQTYWELPYELQRELALAALSLGVSQRLLTSANAKIARTMIENNLTEAQVSRELGASKQAVNQQMKRVRKHLSKIIDTQEFSL